MIRVEVEDSAADTALQRLAALVTDMTPLMQELGEYLTTSTKDRFPTGRAPDGTPWAQKSPATLERYGARKSNRIDRRPLFGPSGMLSSQIHSEAGPTAVEWGSNLIYAATMQFGAAKGAFGTTARGGPIPWGHIPARPFLGLSQTDRASVLDIITEHLAAATPRKTP